MNKWLKSLLSNKYLNISLGLYVILQLLTLIVHGGFLFIAYEISYLLAIVISINWTYRTYKSKNSFISLLFSIILIFISNLLLFLVYIPTLLLNPEINWTLKNGGGETDPMILLAYFPLVHFAISTIVILLFGLIFKLTIKNSLTSQNNW